LRYLAPWRYLLCNYPSHGVLRAIREPFSRNLAGFSRIRGTQPFERPKTQTPACGERKPSASLRSFQSCRRLHVFGPDSCRASIGVCEVVLHRIDQPTTALLKPWTHLAASRLPWPPDVLVCVILGNITVSASSLKVSRNFLVVDATCPVLWRSCFKRIDNRLGKLLRNGKGTRGVDRLANYCSI